MIGLNVRAITITLLKESVEINLHDLGLGNDFLAMMPKAQAIKEQTTNWTLSTFKTFLTNTVKKVKRQATD